MAWVWTRLRDLTPGRALALIDDALDRLQRALTIPEPIITVPNVGGVYTPDMSRGVVRVFQIIVTSGAAFTIARPKGFQAGALLTLDVVNSSGGALGAITWAADYVFLKAFVPPAAAGRSTVTFYCGSTVSANQVVQIAMLP